MDTLTTLFQILSSEQQIAQRTDQKALHLLSALGVILVFFLAHFQKISLTPLAFGLVCSYLLATFITLIALLRVITPRIDHTHLPQVGANPTFFGGIAQCAHAGAYEKHLRSFIEDPDAVFHIFADSIFTVGKINAFKHRWIQRSLLAFTVAIALELLLAASTYLQIFLATTPYR